MLTTPYKRKPGTLDAEADFARPLEQCDVVNGRRVTITLDGTSNVQFFEHGLERAFFGAFAVGRSSTLTTARLDVMRPQTVESLGRDPAKVFAMRPSIASSEDVDVWVF